MRNFEGVNGNSTFQEEAELTGLRSRAYLYDCIVVNEPKLLPSTAEEYLQCLTAVFGGVDAKEDATKQTAAQFINGHCKNQTRR